jgi:predicted RNA-binding protein with PUA-like domain
VRNFQARNNLAAMQVGDQCLVYHSQANPGVVGTAQVVKAAYPDPKSEDPRWVNVDVRAGQALARRCPWLNSNPPCWRRWRWCASRA